MRLVWGVLSSVRAPGWAPGPAAVGPFRAGGGRVGGATPLLLPTKNISASQLRDLGLC